MANNYCQCTPALSLKATKEEADKLIKLIDTPQNEDEESHGFTIEYSGKSFYMYADEIMDTDGLPAIFLKELGRLIKKNKLPYLQFGYAFTCSKMRPDEFDGGQFRIHTDSTVEYPYTVWGNKVKKLKNALKYAINELKEFGSKEAVEELQEILKQEE